MHGDGSGILTQDTIDAMIQMYQSSATFGKSTLSIMGRRADLVVLDDLWAAPKPSATYPLTGRINHIGWTRLYKPKIEDIRYDLSRIYSDPIVLHHEHKAELDEARKQVDDVIISHAGNVTIEQYKKACVYLAVGEMKLKFGFDASFPPPIIRPKPTIDQMVAAIKPEKPREKSEPEIQDRPPSWSSSGSIRSLRSGRKNEKR